MTSAASSKYEGNDPSHTNDMEILARGTARDLRALQIKLTYVGPQTKAVPSVVFTTFYHLVDMGWFIPTRKPDLNYGNDETFLWSFSVVPDEMKQVVAALGETESLKSKKIDDPHLSLMAVLNESRLGQIAFEVVLDRHDAEEATNVILNALDESNGVGRKVIELHRQLILDAQIN